jgi:hypothetical protein
MFGVFFSSFEIFSAADGALHSLFRGRFQEIKTHLETLQAQVACGAGVSRLTDNRLREAPLTQRRTPVSLYQ